MAPIASGEQVPYQGFGEPEELAAPIIAGADTVHNPY